MRTAWGVDGRPAAGNLKRVAADVQEAQDVPRGRLDAGHQLAQFLALVERDGGLPALPCRGHALSLQFAQQRQHSGVDRFVHRAFQFDPPDQRREEGVNVGTLDSRGFGLLRGRHTSRRPVRAAADGRSSALSAHRQTTCRGAWAAAQRTLDESVRGAEVRAPGPFAQLHILDGVHVH